MPFENRWITGATPLDVVYHFHSFDDVEESVPKGVDLLTGGRRRRCLEILFQITTVGIFQQHIVGFVLLKTPIEINDTLPKTTASPQSSKRSDFDLVLFLGIFETVRFQDIDVGISAPGVLLCNW